MNPNPRRLDAFLARAGLGTRSEVRRVIRKGRVSIDGVACRDAAAHVDGKAVTVDGEPVVILDVEHALLHKPVGYACSHDPREAPTVDDLLPEAWLALGLRMAGRLDRDTSGLLILSQDGGFIHRLTHPKHKLAKRYQVTYTGTLPPDAVLRCAQGMPLPPDEDLTRPAELMLQGEGKATLILREGRHHQVRRMFEAMGTEVIELHRDRIGDLDLPADLLPGQVRPLTEGERDQLLSSSTL